MSLNIGAVILGGIFFIDWLFKSFITGMFFGNLIYKKIIHRVNKELDNCNYFGEEKH